MLKFKKITIQNFMSIGQLPQTIQLEDSGLTLVLGDNTDSEIVGSRNGAGKTTIINAISYALFGQALTNIKRDNLINKTNNKGMLVKIEFSINDNNYVIERGRKPNVVVWQVNNNLVESPDTNEAEGESKWTQSEIEKTIQITHNLFKHILALNTFTEPFLALKAGEQRDVIEELFGISQLSNKSIILRDLLKDTRDGIKQEEITIKAKKEANDKVQQSIDTIKLKSRRFEIDKEQKLETLSQKLEKLAHVDIEKEIESHKKIVVLVDLGSKLNVLERELKQLVRAKDSSTRELEQLERKLSSIKEDKCHVCEQNLPGHKHELIKQELESQIEEITKTFESTVLEIIELDDSIKLINSDIDLVGAVPDTFYKTIEEAYNHKNEISLIEQQLVEAYAGMNPYDDQVKTLETTGISEISYDEINRLTDLKTHQEFLLKLLTDKGSFIRKKIIDQNLSLLNHRLTFYLDKIGLPHDVKFQNDLSVEILYLGRDFDFDNLSRGERNRLILSLSWAFRDVYESMNNPINLSFVDELADAGMDLAGVEAVMSVLKEMSRTRNKTIFLISHRDELISRCENILTVKKENGFTTIETGDV